MHRPAALLCDRLRSAADWPIMRVVIRLHQPLRRRGPAALILAAALIVCALIVAPHGASADADDTAEPRLPTVVNAPGPWSDVENRKGPVAAIGLAHRIIPVGITGKREDLVGFATSALDGSSSWLRLPGFSGKQFGFEDGVALSPDGRWLGWVRAAKGWAIKGWSILDTTTGVVRELKVEGHERVKATWSELAFSGDSRHLLTTFKPRGKPTRGHPNLQFVAWSVSDGTPTLLEQPGTSTVPLLGHAADGVVWSRKNRVFRADAETGRRSVVTLPHSVVMASWAPGDAAFAYIGRDHRKKGDPPAEERLYVGATPSSATRVVDLPETSPIGEALAWRDATHVVVGNFRGEMYVVDITDGSYETVRVAGSGEQLNTPLLATALWANPRREPVAPTGTTDPRRPWRWAGIGIFVALLGGGAAVLRRAGQAGRSRPSLAPSDAKGQL